MFSRAVNSGSEVSACGMTPMEWRTPSASVTTSCPPTVAVPEVGGVSVVIIRINVVLPAPLGPSKPKISPVGTVKLTSFTATKSPNCFLSLLTTIAFVSVTFMGPAVSPKRSSGDGTRCGVHCRSQPLPPVFCGRERRQQDSGGHAGGDPASGSGHRHLDGKSLDVALGAADVALGREIIFDALEKDGAVENVSRGKLDFQVLVERHKIDVAFFHVGLHPEMVHVENRHDRLARLQNFSLAGGADGDHAVQRRVNL